MVGRHGGGDLFTSSCKGEGWRGREGKAGGGGKGGEKWLGMWRERKERVRKRSREARTGSQYLLCFLQKRNSFPQALPLKCFVFVSPNWYSLDRCGMGPSRIPSWLLKLWKGIRRLRNQLYGFIVLPQLLAERATCPCLALEEAERSRRTERILVGPVTFAQAKHFWDIFMCLYW